MVAYRNILARAEYLLDVDVTDFVEDGKEVFAIKDLLALENLANFCNRIVILKFDRIIGRGASKRNFVFKDEATNWLIGHLMIEPQGMEVVASTPKTLEGIDVAAISELNDLAIMKSLENVVDKLGSIIHVLLL